MSVTVVFAVFVLLAIRKDATRIFTDWKNR